MVRSFVVISLVFGSLFVLSCQSRTDTTLQKAKNMHATLKTSKGSFDVELYSADAPKTVANFTGLAEQGYYNGIIVHRISKGFVIQAGDSTGTGAGGRSIYGKDFADELDPAAPSFQAGYLRGTLAMANRGPNTNTSQFFVVLQDAPWLPKNYTIFGRVTTGMEVVDSIAAVAIKPAMGPNDGRPIEDISILSVTVAK